MPSSADELVENIRKNHLGLRGVQHITANHYVTVSGDRATCTANWYNRIRARLICLEVICKVSNNAPLYITKVCKEM